MYFLGKYEELAPGMGFPTMKENLESKPYETKAEVLKYLKSGKPHIATAASVIDVYSGVNTFRPLLHLDDGEFSWTTKLIYYIEKYNLRLPHEVEKRILEKAHPKH